VEGGEGRGRGRGMLAVMVLRVNELVGLRRAMMRMR
jgi:hypothetical protein